MRPVEFPDRDSRRPNQAIGAGISIIGKREERMATTTRKTVTKKAAPGKAPEKKAPEKKVPTRKAPSKKVSAKKMPTKKAAAGKKPTGTSPKVSKPGTSRIEISPEERWKMVAVAAYLKAEKRGFAPGHELEDWTEAENEIDAFMSRT